MLFRAPWTRVLLLALTLHAPSWGASLSPIALTGVADTVIVLGDGSLLFNDNHGPTFSRLVPATGEVIEINVGTPQTRDPTLGADGRLWFTIDSARQVGRYALTTGLLDLFVLPDNISGSFGAMVLGLEGSLWATATDSNRILRIAPTGAMSTYDLPSYDPHPLGIALGPDGNIWFAERNAGKIGRITSTGTVTEFTIPPQLTTGPSQIVRGNDGGLWFATDDGFGRVATNGVFTLFPTGAQTAGGRLVLAPDGTFWLATGDGFVTQFTPPSGVARLHIWDQPAQSTGMYFDSAGNLYITDASLRQFGRVMKMVGASATPGDTRVIEFFNSGLQHYFITASAEEAAGIDAGTAGPNWSRTGETWPAWLAGPLPGATEVCRFYGNADIDPVTHQRRGPNSHFYTFQGPECEQVKNDPGWVYEPLNRYFTVQPTAGLCPGATLPVYRVYNNGFARNDSNHRYTIRTTIYNQMISQGWSGEGVVMCTAPAAQ
jgi:virginiamycin B lyase